jgi:hypothetical protein
MSLTSATHDDLDEVVDLVNQAYRATASGGWTTEAGLIEGSRVDRESLAQTIQAGTTTLVARDQASRHFQGCVAVRPLESANGICQTAGLGKSIMAAAETFAIERGARSIKISVIEVRRALIAWYERRGYKRSGDVEPFPYGDLSVGVALRDDLTLAILRKQFRD